jgi:PAS domain-containing protein
MQKVCAWCNAPLENTEEQHNGNELVSHGICEKCYENLLSSENKTLGDLLDRFSDPVFLIDSYCKIMVGNRAACALIGKQPSEIAGRLGGEALECRHSREPGGCGQTIHCKSCVIRRTIQSTLESGQSHNRVPAYLDLLKTCDEKIVRFLISTEKIGNAVLLRIDEVTSMSE